MCKGPEAMAGLMSCRKLTEAKVKYLGEKVRDGSRKAGHTKSCR